MTLLLYRCESENNRIDKSGFINSKPKLVSGTLKSASSIINPVILIEETDRISYNYAFIFEFGRYFYIHDIISVRNNLWELVMQVDVLMSFRKSIYNLYGFIDRNENEQNPYIVDKKRLVYEGVTSEEIEPTISCDVIKNDELDDNNDYYFVLSGYKIDVEAINE